jgi:hypothetical protein
VPGLHPLRGAPSIFLNNIRANPGRGRKERTMNTTASSIANYIAACAIAVATTAYAADATDARASAKRQYQEAMAKCKQMSGAEMKQCRKDAKTARDNALAAATPPTATSPDLVGAAIPNFAGSNPRP